MDALILLRALLVFIFNNHGPRDVMPVAYAGIALWSVAAFAYSSLVDERPQPPLFFAVPPRRARWAWADPFPRTWWYACLGALALLVVIINSASAQITTPDFKTIDAVIDAYVPKLSAYELSYYDTRGRYMQALWSHSTPPADGALVAPDLLASKPTDQSESFADLWSAVVVADGKIPVRLRIDVYDGPSGRGYVVSVQCILAGRMYMRSINVGNERWRDVDWVELKAETLP